MRRRIHSAAFIASIIPSLAFAQTTPATNPLLPFTIAKDTTLLSQPLKSNGTVDYVAAVNITLGKDVTPQNNGFVTLLQIVGTSNALLAGHADEILKASGAQPSSSQWTPPPSEPNAAPNDNITASRLFALAQSAPWNPADHLNWDAWLDANQRPLNLARLASRQPHFWIPLVASDEQTPLMSADRANTNVLHPLREIVQALQLRAMRSLFKSNADSAWQDLDAAHRLSRQFAQAPNSLSLRIAIAQDNVTLAADSQLIQSPHANLQLVRDVLSTLQKLPPFPNIMSSMRRKDIYNYPDAIQQMAISFENKWNNPKAPGGAASTQMTLQTAGFHSPDWDRMLRYGNAFFDNLYMDTSTLSPEQSRKRSDDLDALLQAADHDRSKEDKNNPDGYLLPQKNESRDAYSDRLARRLISALTPSLASVQLLADRQSKAMEFTILACALEIYYRDTGTFPDSLATLIPKYIPAIPKDFSDKPLDYTHTKTSFRIFSLGLNNSPEEAAKNPSSSITIEINH
ncbi:MAG TPA: hypothetical protein VGN88_02885 [Phycisphaerae bacterium]|jgi:hypothetical protein